MPTTTLCSGNEGISSKELNSIPPSIFHQQIQIVALRSRAFLTSFPSLSWGDVKIHVVHLQAIIWLCNKTRNNIPVSLIRKFISQHIFQPDGLLFRLRCIPNILLLLLFCLFLSTRKITWDFPCTTFKPCDM